MSQNEETLVVTEEIITIARANLPRESKLDFFEPASSRKLLPVLHPVPNRILILFPRDFISLKSPKTVELFCFTLATAASQY